MRRRLMLQRSAALVGAGLGAGAGLGGCGFTLRAAPSMPFRSIALVDFAPGSTVERALRTQLLQVVTVSPQPARADVVLQALRDTRERAVVASTAAGQVREIQLRTRLMWRTSTPQGKELSKPFELLLTRDMSYQETAALAKEQEAEALFVAMDEDIAMQVLRQLARLTLG